MDVEVLHGCLGFFDLGLGATKMMEDALLDVKHALVFANQIGELGIFVRNELKSHRHFNALQCHLESSEIFAQDGNLVIRLLELGARRASEMIIGFATDRDVLWNFWSLWRIARSHNSLLCLWSELSVRTKVCCLLQLGCNVAFHLGGIAVMIRIGRAGAVRRLRRHFGIAFLGSGRLSFWAHWLLLLVVWL